MPENPENSSRGLSRRNALTVGGAGLLATAAVTAAAVPAAATTQRADASSVGTPEQIHLTWGNDPATSVVVSWSSPGRAIRPRVHIGGRVIEAEERPYTDGLNGETTYTYHARISRLRPGTTPRLRGHRRQQHQRGRPLQRDVHHRCRATITTTSGPSRSAAPTTMPAR